MKLDYFDLKIISLLDTNARISLSEIGHTLRLSKSAVAQRIKKMEDNGIILGYYTVIDSSRLGYLSFRVYLKFHKTTPQKEESIINFLLNEKRVWWLGLIQGNWNVGFVVWVKDLYDFRNFWLDFLSHFRQNIGKHNISPYVKLRHFASAYVNDLGYESKEAGIVGEGPKISLDSVDLKVLQVIAENARASTVELAKKSGLTPAVVKYRLRILFRKGVISAFRTKINNSMLGYSLYKLEFILDDLSKIREMQEFSKRLSNLLYLDETIGGADFEAEFSLRNEQELEELLKKFKVRFSNSIREINYIVYSKVLKCAYYPV